MAKLRPTARSAHGKSAAKAADTAADTAAANTPADRDDGATDEDSRAFQAAVRDVKPLKAVPPAPGREKPKARVRRRSDVFAAESLDEVMPLIDAAADVSSLTVAGEPPAVTSDGVLTFQRGGVRIQVMRRLRRGLLPVEAELDLHGLNQTAARSLLAEFITHSRAGGRRCVRIVHGKGYRSGARGPVLKTAVNLWLRRHLDVMAFVSARAIDGGTGALYVLLRA